MKQKHEKDFTFHSKISPKMSLMKCVTSDSFWDFLIYSQGSSNNVDDRQEKVIAGMKLLCHKVLQVNAVSLILMNEKVFCFLLLLSVNYRGNELVYILFE